MLLRVDAQSSDTSEGAQAAVARLTTREGHVLFNTPTLMACFREHASLQAEWGARTRGPKQRGLTIHLCDAQVHHDHVAERSSRRTRLAIMSRSTAKFPSRRSAFQKVVTLTPHVLTLNLHGWELHHDDDARDVCANGPTNTRSLRK